MTKRHRVPTLRIRRWQATACLLLTVGAASPLAAQSSVYDREVQRLAARADVAAAQAFIDRDRERTRQVLIVLTEVPAPPFAETERGRVYAGMLRDAGADSVWTDAVGNVLALRRGRTRERTVAVTGHLDTVFPEGTDVSVRERGDTLFAPGIGDDTWGITVVLTLLRAVAAADVRTDADLLFVGTVGEEGLGDLRGVKHLFREGGARIDAFISVDGIAVEGITHEGLGSYRYRVTFRGPGGHSWGAFGLANPHHALGRAIAHFAQGADRYTREGARTSYNVGRISGGTSVNSIPFESSMEVDMRSESPARLDGIDTLFHRAVRRGLDEENAVRRRGDSLTVDMALIGSRPSGEIDAATPLVQRAFAATRYVGVEPRGNRSSTDANVPIALGIPAVTIGGGGRGGGAHSLDEWWYDAESTKGIKRALLMLLAEAGMDS